jgi:hypothetical protein
MSEPVQGPPSDLVEALMKDPVKRALLLQLLVKEKDGFEAYKREELKNTTPLKKVKRMHCESPTALQRRRALEQRNQDTSESSSSEMSEASTEVRGPKLPFDQLLKGVRAYVEVRRDNVDRSDGIKAVMRLMGATIMDQFTKDVTHVIFKDGSFTTFEKARLMKIHLVSVLWLDAVRRHNARVPEKNYPAFGNQVSDNNVSILCSQLQKDYEEVIKDEKRRTISSLPKSSKPSDKNRRRTMMTPQTSRSSYLTAQNVTVSDDDQEVATILSQKPSESPDLTSDDSDCGVVNGHTSKRQRNDLDLVEMSVLTDDESGTTKRATSSSRLDSSDSTSLLSRVTVRQKRKTNYVTADMVLTPNVESATRSKNTLEADKSKKVLQNSTHQSSAVSLLGVSTDSERTKSGLAQNESQIQKRNSKSSDKENRGSGGTVMSSLRLSDSLQMESRRSGSKLSLSPKKQSLGSSSVSSRSSKSDVSEKGRRSKNIELADTRKEEIPSGRRKGTRAESEDRNRIECVDETIDGSDCGTRSSRRVRRTTAMTPRAAVEDQEDSSEKERKGRRATSVGLQTGRNTNEIEGSQSVEVGKLRRSSRRSTSVFSSRSESGKGTSSNEIRRSESEELEDSLETERTAARRKSNVIDKPQAADAGTVRRSRRSISVVSSRSRFESEDVIDDSQKPAKAVVAVVSSEDEAKKSKKAQESPRPVKKSKKAQESPSPPEKSKKPQESPSPPKKSRIDSASTKKKRKLYNPNDVVGFSPPQDDKEREEYQKQKSQKSPDGVQMSQKNLDGLQKSQKSPDGVFVNPNNVHITPLPSRQKTATYADVRTSSSDESEIIKIKPTKKKKKKEKTPERRDSSTDEQRELLDLLTNRVDASQPRRSQRLTLSETRPKYTYSSLDSQSTSSLPITPIKRRSTLDFVSISESQRKRKLKPKRTSSIVCTKMHRHQVLNFESIVNDLGEFFVEDRVTDKTTHLVVGDAKRTINMLRAIARGCWILKHEWVSARGGFVRV